MLTALTATSLLLAPLALAEDPAASPELGESQWYLESLGVAGLVEEGQDGEGVLVAVLDSGVDKTHPDLAGSFWTNTREVPGNGLDDDMNGYVDDVHGWDMCHDAPVRDEPPNGHGTFVAGVVTADGRGHGGVMGVAPAATIMDVQVYCDDNEFPSDREPLLEPDALREGLRYAIDAGADIILMSLQLWLDDGHSTLEDLLGVKEEFQRAHDAGILLVGAAGNLNGYGPASPGDQPHVFTVGAETGCEWRHGFSNHGPGIDIWAPGRALSTIAGGGWEWWEGTSFAAPMVAGAAALLLQDDSSFSPDEVKAALLDMARPIEDGPSLDLHAWSGIPTPDPPGAVEYLGNTTISDLHYLQFTGPAAPLLELDVMDSGESWCIHLESFGDGSFFVRDLQSDGEVHVRARLHDGLQGGPWNDVVLAYDESLDDTSERPLWASEQDLEAVATPGVGAAALGLVVALAARRR